MSASPHQNDSDNTALIMGRVIIALIPALVWACYIFGMRALSLTVISVASCMLFEFLFCVICKKPVRLYDLSAVVTGILIAFNLPVSAPLWIPVFGALFAIVVVKMLFGGLGKNIVNPALAARVFLLMSWTGEMTAFTKPGEKFSPFELSVSSLADAVSTSTPLVSLKNTDASKSVLEWLDGKSILDMFCGNIGGCLGEVSAVLLIAGGLYLIFSGVITWHIPAAYIATVAVITCFLPHGAAVLDPNYIAAQLFSGGLMLGAFFMATDYATSPLTNTGKLIYGVGCGLITVFIRYFGGYPEGVSFSILIMNLLVWYIDKLGMPRVFGTKRKKLFGGKSK